MAILGGAKAVYGQVFKVKVQKKTPTDIWD